LKQLRRVLDRIEIDVVFKPVIGNFHFGNLILTTESTKDTERL
jgi:hypothetical protein